MIVCFFMTFKTTTIALEMIFHKRILIANLIWCLSTWHIDYSHISSSITWFHSVSRGSWIWSKSAREHSKKGLFWDFSKHRGRVITRPQSCYGPPTPATLRPAVRLPRFPPTRHRPYGLCRVARRSGSPCRLRRQSPAEVQGILNKEAVGLLTFSYRVLALDVCPRLDTNPFPSLKRSRL